MVTATDDAKETVPDPSTGEDIETTQPEETLPEGEAGAEEGAEETPETIPVKKEIPVYDENGVPYVNLFGEQKRLTEKFQRELEELKRGQTIAQVPFDEKKYYTDIALKLGLYDENGQPNVQAAKNLDTYMNQKVYTIGGQMTKPAAVALCSMAYERNSEVLKSDTVNYPDLTEIKPVMDRIVKETLTLVQYQNPILWDDPKLMTDIVKMARGELALKWRAEALKKGRDMERKNKTILGEAKIPGSKTVATSSGGITQEIKAMAERLGVSEKDAKEIWESRQKNKKK